MKVKFFNGKTKATAAALMALMIFTGCAQAAPHAHNNFQQPPQPRREAPARLPHRPEEHGARAPRPEARRDERRGSSGNNGVAMLAVGALIGAVVAGSN
ncbi:MAG: hypothetical protein Q4D58_06595 [Synergistaceae bacterium]|nr:hypothetical protein [Synergistaceae bacterium]